MNLVKDPQTFRDWVSDKGIWGQLACVGLMFLQVAIAVLPGEPLEIAAATPSAPGREWRFA